MAKVKSKKKQKTRDSGKNLLNSDGLKDSDQSEAEVENLESDITDEPKETVERIEEVVKPSKGKSKKKRKAKDSGKPSAVSSSVSELPKLENNLDGNHEDDLFCVACNKELRNEKDFAAHRNQKKKKKNRKKKNFWGPQKKKKKKKKKKK